MERSKKSVGILGGMGALATVDLLEQIVLLPDAASDAEHIRVHTANNTAHYYLPQLQALTEVPFLNMLDISAKACRERFPGGTAAVLATAGTLSTGLYQAVLAAAEVPCLVPDEAEQAALMRVIYDGVKAGAAPETYRQELEDVLTALTARGADCFILGCTELPPAFRLLGLDAPVIDPTEELAKAAIRFCGYHVKGEP